MEGLIQDISLIDEVKPSASAKGKGKLFIESYGCQMNFSDSEIVASILKKDGFDLTQNISEADLIFLNTCSIREKAEQTVRDRLIHIKGFKKLKPDLIVGVLGCMAERLKTKLIEEEKIVDLVAGPDAYRTLPELIAQVDDGNKAVNTLLSREETYFDVNPVRLNSNGVTAFISIMRGCDNMCSFCVVPFTRGRERSRDPQSILAEAKQLFENGFREVTLLGQNVDSYLWSEEENNKARLLKNVSIKDEERAEYQNKKFATKESGVTNFANLLEQVAQINPLLRIRFTTSHPKDITDDVLETMARYENICKNIHLPAQSGNTRILELMKRGYTREWYLDRVRKIREVLGNDCGLSCDMITGFCTETQAEHEETLSLMDEVKFDYAYMFVYSERPGTLAAKKYADDISPEVKKERLEQIIVKQRLHSHESNLRDVGKVFKVLVEGTSRRSDEFLQGRNSANKVIVFPKQNFKKGDYVMVKVDNCTSGTLTGRVE
jgi:tRNA-2-methylthio-N6-dimethylallyladenosine synthase